ncbi:hypothetical protein WDU94_005931 [Cyamophila willieti]
MKGRSLSGPSQTPSTPASLDLSKLSHMESSELTLNCTKLFLPPAGHSLDRPKLPSTPASLDLSKLSHMESSELGELVKHYAKENEALRRENQELFTSRDLLVRDQELVCRENERLLKTLEDFTSGRSRADSLPPSRSSSSTSSNNNDRDLVYSPGGSVLQGPKFRVRFHPRVLIRGSPNVIGSCAPGRFKGRHKNMP